LVYYTCDQLLYLINDMNMTTAIYPVDFSLLNHKVHPDQNDFFEFSTALVQISSIISEKITKQIKNFQPDVIVYDSFAYWGKIICKKIDVFGVCSITHYPFTELDFTVNSDLFIRKILKDKVTDEKKQYYMHYYKSFSKYLSKKYLNKDCFAIWDIICGNDTCNLVYTCRELYNRNPLRDDIYHFVGPLIKQEQKEKEDIDIYVSFGSMLSEKYSIYKTCIQALENMGLKSLISVGNSNRIKNTSPHIKIINYADQIAALQSCTVFISHGGFNSVNEALYYGVPLIVMPFATDAYFTAEEIQAIPLGICIEPSVQASQLCFCIERVKRDSEIQKNVLNYRNILNRMNGLEDSVKLIVNKGKKELYSCR